MARCLGSGVCVSSGTSLPYQNPFSENEKRPCSAFGIVRPVAVLLVVAPPACAWRCKARERVARKQTLTAHVPFERCFSQIYSTLFRRIIGVKWGKRRKYSVAHFWNHRCTVVARSFLRLKRATASRFFRFTNIIVL